MRRRAGRLSDIVTVGRLRLNTTPHDSDVRRRAGIFRRLSFACLIISRINQDGPRRRQSWPSIFGASDAVEANAIEAIVARLRRKFGPEIITTRRRFGYLLEADT